MNRPEDDADVLPHWSLDNLILQTYIENRPISIHPANGSSSISCFPQSEIKSKSVRFAETTLWYYYPVKSYRPPPSPSFASFFTIFLAKISSFFATSLWTPWLLIVKWTNFKTFKKLKSFFVKIRQQCGDFWYRRYAETARYKHDYANVDTTATIGNPFHNEIK